jgi:phycocyanobilin lyase beta subunit
MVPDDMNSQTSVEQRIANVQSADSAEALLSAVEHLAAAKHPSATACLLEILGFNNPGAAVAAVDGLIAIGEPAVEPILASLGTNNYGARAWSVRALAGIADPRGLEVLERALATDIGPSVRRAAASGLGRLDLRSLPDEQASGLVERCLQALLLACGDGEWIVRYAVVVGLEGLALQQAERISDLSVEALRHALAGLAAGSDPLTPVVVQRRSALALHRIDHSAGPHG